MTSLMHHLETNLLHDGVLRGNLFLFGWWTDFIVLKTSEVCCTAKSEIYAAIDAAKVVTHLKLLGLSIECFSHYESHAACNIMGSQLGNYNHARQITIRLSYLQQIVQRHNY